MDTHPQTVSSGSSDTTPLPSTVVVSSDSDSQTTDAARPSSATDIHAPPRLPLMITTGILLLIITATAGTWAYLHVRSLARAPIEKPIPLPTSHPLTAATTVPLSAQTTTNTYQNPFIFPTPTISAYPFGKYLNPFDDDTLVVGVDFPIETLDNCTSVQSCKTYCDNPLHRAQCVALVKAQGNISETDFVAQVYETAVGVLGCRDKLSCQLLCESPENTKKCIEFAKRWGKEHQKGPPDAYDIQLSALLSAAKTTLGCSTLSQCVTFCHRLENQTRCTLLNTTMATVTPNPPSQTPADTCADGSLCAHPTVSSETSSTKKKGIVGLVGTPECKTISECEAYCTTYPDRCPGFATSDSGE